jgi:hypothetical protein
MGLTGSQKPRDTQHPGPFTQGIRAQPAPTSEGRPGWHTGQTDHTGLEGAWCFGSQQRGPGSLVLSLTSHTAKRR